MILREALLAVFAKVLGSVIKKLFCILSLLFPLIVIGISVSRHHYNNALIWLGMVIYILVSKFTRQADEEKQAVTKGSKMIDLLCIALVLLVIGGNFYLHHYEITLTWLCVVSYLMVFELFKSHLP